MSDPAGKQMPTLSKALEQTGESKRLRDYIAERLVQSGWRDDLKSYAVEYIKTKGAEKISVEDIVAEIAPRGRATVPDSLKADVLQKVRDFAKAQGLH
ncbi:unnamed protein product [Amoebophrya sp. A120]|nr:unnamed protein product [Amoebophrya sp. A120]|eukprot:GSA120T00020684001.1